MAENRAHGESCEKRLRRFQNGSPTESIATLLNSISNFFNNEIKEAPRNTQTSLLFLGIHASILSISEALFDKSGLEGYRYFLEKFVDGDTKDLQFSLVSSRIHDWRNILAHQWLGSSGHNIAYDYNMKEGWKEVDGILFINPQIYCNQYLKAFSGDSLLWEYDSYLGQTEQEDARDRIIAKFIHR